MVSAWSGTAWLLASVASAQSRAPLTNTVIARNLSIIA
jgi:hypothetical protein